MTYAPVVGYGRLVIDEDQATNATATTKLDISWLNEQQERLNLPPAPSNNKQ